MTQRKAYEVTARRDGRWWLVEVPELDTVGQARNAAEVEEVAREVIGLWLDVEPDTFDVAVTIEIPENAREAWEESKKREAVARTEIEAAATLAREAVATLRADGLTYRDAGAVLGLSAQRVQQLAASEATASRAESINPGAEITIPAGYSVTVQSNAGAVGGEIRSKAGATRKIRATTEKRRRAGV